MPKAVLIQSSWPYPRRKEYRDRRPLSLAGEPGCFTLLILPIEVPKPGEVAAVATPRPAVEVAKVMQFPPREDELMCIIFNDRVPG